MSNDTGVTNISLVYKDYIAHAVYDNEIGLYFGTVVNTRGIVTFYGASLPELGKEFATSIKVYLDVCKENGIES